MNQKEKYKNLFSFSKSEISAFFKDALRVYRSPDLDLLCKPAALSYGRFLPLTPRRLGNAPTRNKIRRQLKAIFYEQNLSLLGIDCLAILKKDILTHSFDQLQELLLFSLKKAEQRLKKQTSSNETS